MNCVPPRLFCSFKIFSLASCFEPWSKCRASWRFIESFFVSEVAFSARSWFKSPSTASQTQGKGSNAGSDTSGHLGPDASLSCPSFSVPPAQFLLATKAAMPIDIRLPCGTCVIGTLGTWDREFPVSAFGTGGGRRPRACTGTGHLLMSPAPSCDWSPRPMSFQDLVAMAIKCQALWLKCVSDCMDNFVTPCVYKSLYIQLGACMRLWIPGVTLHQASHKNCSLLEMAQQLVQHQVVAGLGIICAVRMWVHDFSQTGCLLVPGRVPGLVSLMIFWMFSGFG